MDGWIIFLHRHIFTRHLPSSRLLFLTIVHLTFSLVLCIVFVYLYLYTCICVYVHLYVCICIFVCTHTFQPTNWSFRCWVSPPSTCCWSIYQTNKKGFIGELHLASFLHRCQEKLMIDSDICYFSLLVLFKKKKISRFAAKRVPWYGWPAPGRQHSPESWLSTLPTSPTWVLLNDQLIFGVFSCEEVFCLIVVTKVFVRTIWT